DRMLKTRLLSAVVAIPLLLLLILGAGPLAFLLLVLAVNGVALVEWLGLVPGGPAWSAPSGRVVLVGLGSALLVTFHHGDLLWVCAVLATGVVGTLAWSLSAERGGALEEWSRAVVGSMAGLLYV